MYTTASVMVDRCMGNVQTVKRLMEVGANINYQNKVLLQLHDNCRHKKFVGKGNVGGCN